MEAEITSRTHPATFSTPILAKAASMIGQGRGLALDPLAGVGKGLDLLESAGYKAIGWEIEPEWASQDPRIRCGNFLDNDLASACVDLAFTSPSYGNRMSDSYAGSPADLEHLARTGKIRRRTYRIALNRPLTAGNAASEQWGEAYQIMHGLLWSELARVLRPGGRFLLNISDHIRDHEVQPVSAWHFRYIMAVTGLRMVNLATVRTARYRDGANREARVPFEYLALFEKP